MNPFGVLGDYFIQQCKAKLHDNMVSEGCSPQDINNVLQSPIILSMINVAVANKIMAMTLEQRDKALRALVPITNSIPTVPHKECPCGGTVGVCEFHPQ